MQTRIIAIVAVGLMVLAGAICESVVLFHRASAMYYNNRGLAYMHEQFPDFDLAVGEFSQGIRQYPRDVACYDNRGLAEYCMEKYPQALQDFTMTIRLQPSAEHYLSRSRVYLCLKQYQNAIVDCNNALELSPRHASAYNNRGWAYFYLKRYPQALQDFSMSITLKPTATYYVARSGVYYRLKQFANAITDCDSALKLNPRNAVAYSNRGWLYYNLKQYHRALADLNQALSIDPSLVLAKNHREQVLRAMGK